MQSKLITKFDMPQSQTKTLSGTLLLKNYQVQHTIGTGAFGQIYTAETVTQPIKTVAIKAEPTTAKHPQLILEFKVYKQLHHKSNPIGLPKVYTAGTENGYNLMCMELLGKSLEQVFSENNKKFTIKTVILIGLEILQRIEYIHSKGFLHGDIKPENLLLSPESQFSPTIYLIDFGLSKKYISSNSLKTHIPYREGRQLTGTARYASINAHKGFQQGRRDDIESIGYILMYFLRGILPWQNIKATSVKMKYELIKNKKMNTSLDELCKGFPSQFQSFLSYGRNLKFDEKPDYELLKGLLIKAALSIGVEVDSKYDWTPDPIQISKT